MAHGEQAPATPELSIAFDDEFKRNFVELTWKMGADGGSVDSFVVLEDDTKIFSGLDTSYRKRFDKTPHQYRVRAKGPGGTTDSLIEVFPAAPGPPANVVATATPHPGGTVITVTWTAPDSGGLVDRYQVIQNGTVQDTRSADSKLTTTYDYTGVLGSTWILAIGPGGQSASDHVTPHSEKIESSTASPQSPGPKTSQSTGPTTTTAESSG